MKFNIELSLDKNRLKELLIDSLGITHENFNDFKIECSELGVYISYNIEFEPEHPDTICAEENSRVWIS